MLATASLAVTKGMSEIDLILAAFAAEARAQSGGAIPNAVIASYVRRFPQHASAIAAVALSLTLNAAEALDRRSQPTLPPASSWPDSGVRRRGARPGAPRR